jgi:hypothetical protein
MADNLEFGSWPLNFVQNGDGLYQIVADHVDNAAACAINTVFDAGQRAIMEARAAAHGYQLSELLPTPPEDKPAKAK